MGPIVFFNFFMLTFGGGHQIFARFRLSGEHKSACCEAGTEQLLQSQRADNALYRQLQCNLCT